MSILSIALAAVAFIAGAAAAYFLPDSRGGFSLEDQKKKLEEAKQEAEQIRSEAKEKSKQMKKAFEEEEASITTSLKNMEGMISQKEEIFRRRQQRNNSYQKNVEALKNEVKKLRELFKSREGEKTTTLSKASGLSPEKALEESRINLERIITENKEMRQNAEMEEFEEDIMRHAAAVLQLVMQRLAVQSSVDKNSTSVSVKEDKFKGMLIGKGGINIQYLEELLPVSIIFNLGDSSTIHVGGVNLIRRHIAKRAIEKLQKQMRKAKSISHEMIKNAVTESETEIMAECDRKGAWAFREVGLDPKEADPELVNLMGRLYFRTSYGQNVLYHSLEMAHAARVIAELIGADPKIAMQATFFHDVGKAIDHDVGGSHDELSKELLEKFQYPGEIVYAAYVHHDKDVCKAAEDFIVKAADSISGGRPGARQESLAAYLERMKQLEAAAKSFEGVNKVFTMSAGREVRVIVNKDLIKDGNMQPLAENVAEKISEEVSFPGMIKVNLIRRTKSVDYARERTKARR
jgi:ribonucrease Y